MEFAWVAVTKIRMTEIFGVGPEHWARGVGLWSLAL